MNEVMTPEEFDKAIEAIYNDDSYDPEGSHVETDGLMETVLKQLGYEKGIRRINDMTRWYA